MIDPKLLTNEELASEAYGMERQDGAEGLFDIYDGDHCRCACHRGGLIHFTACCHGCPYCKSRIIMGRMRHHVESCHVKPVHLPAQAEEVSK